MYGNAPLMKETGVPGWLTEPEQDLLVNSAKDINPVLLNPVVVEIGAEFGGSTSLWCKFTSSKSSIYSVDLFPNGMLDHHRGNLELVGLLRSEQLRGDSQSIGERWGKKEFRKDTGIDLLFIDGDHSYAGVWRDIESWIPFVLPSGLVIFHDYAQTMEPGKWHVLHYEVRRAVDEWFAQASKNGWKFVARADSAIAFRLDVKPEPIKEPVIVKEKHEEVVLPKKPVTAGKKLSTTMKRELEKSKVGEDV